MPHACIGVDVIVGFPGETRRTFLGNLPFLENRFGFPYCMFLPYSERDNTESLPKLDGIRSRRMFRAQTQQNVARIVREKTSSILRKSNWNPKNRAF